MSKCQVLQLSTEQRKTSSTEHAFLYTEAIYKSRFFNQKVTKESTTSLHGENLRPAHSRVTKTVHEEHYALIMILHFSLD